MTTGMAFYMASAGLAAGNSFTRKAKAALTHAPMAITKKK